jgi:hypothetical protein
VPRLELGAPIPLSRVFTTLVGLLRFALLIATLLIALLLEVAANASLE